MSINIKTNIQSASPIASDSSFAKELVNLAKNLPLFKLVRQFSDLDALVSIADQFKKFENVIVLGTGGSSLGGRALCDLADTSGTSVHFYDNIDPHTFKRLFAKMNLKTTGVIVISKSGGTAETLMQTLVLINQWSNANLKIKNHFLVITEPTNSGMRELATTYDIQTLDHPADIGGRFAVFTLVGMLPALISGLDIHQFRQGALDCLTELDTAPLNHQAVHGAQLQYNLLDQNKTISVIMPYVDRLATFALWYRQLWAESLGKNGKGTTPIAALGTVDQHSQLQLFLDGPKDKFFTILTTNYDSSDFTITIPSTHKHLSLFNQKTMGQLMMAEQMATIDTLTNNNCPVRHIQLEQINEYTLGQLMMHYVIETLAMAILLKVDAFDQPAVEESKVLTRNYLQNP